MNILFLHRNFPAQFRYILQELAKDTDNKIFFITRNEILQLEGVNKIIYPLKREVQKGYGYSKFYEESIIHGQGAADEALKLKKQGFIPDIIYGHAWGPTMFMKDIFPDVPLLCYFEWFYNSVGGDIGFDGRIPNENGKAKVRCKNSHILVDLYSCDAGITPTNWQKNQLPKEFHNKIKVLYDGINTDFCKPDDDAKFLVKDKNLELTAKDEVITYASRGMEPYRGFPQFMEAVEKLLKTRPNAHFIIAGVDKVYYSPKPDFGTYKEIMLQKLDIDMNRVHFVDGLPFNEYVKLLQISSAHVYLTYPFVLSWSALDAMSVGCCTIASNTPPVLEFMQDNYNALLFDFYNVEQLVEKVEYALDNKDKMQELKNNARKTIVDNYALKDLLPQHIDFVKSLIKK